MCGGVCVYVLVSEHAEMKTAVYVVTVCFPLFCIYEGKACFHISNPCGDICLVPTWKTYIKNMAEALMVCAGR